MKGYQQELRNVRVELRNVRVELRNVRVVLRNVRVELRNVRVELRNVRVELRNVRVEGVLGPRGTLARSPTLVSNLAVRPTEFCILNLEKAKSQSLMSSWRLKSTFADLRSRWATLCECRKRTPSATQPTDSPRHESHTPHTKHTVIVVRVLIPAMPLMIASCRRGLRVSACASRAIMLGNVSYLS